jgi:sugar/nucleoside kinase (ribokinase family)
MTQFKQLKKWQSTKYKNRRRKMKHYSSVIIGHITMDHNIDHLGNEEKIVGGAVLYSSASAYALGHTVAAVTKLSPADIGRMDAFTIPTQDIFCIPSSASTDMRNQYLTADKERRICSCSSKGDSFELCDIPNFDTDIYHFAGLIYGDFSSQMMIELSKKAPIAVDVQACLRHANPDGSIFFEDWADKKAVLPYVTYLKTDAAEAQIMTGLEDRYEAAKLLHIWGAKEVMVTHNSEVIVYDGKDSYSCPLRARNLSGRTGRGDTTFAAYINERLSHDIKDSLLFAAATVSKKMETPGPLKGTRADIAAYIDEFFKDYK